MHPTTLIAELRQSWRSVSPGRRHSPGDGQGQQRRRPVGAGRRTDQIDGGSQVLLELTPGQSGIVSNGRVGRIFLH